MIFKISRKVGKILEKKRLKDLDFSEVADFIFKIQELLFLKNISLWLLQQIATSGYVPEIKTTAISTFPLCFERSFNTWIFTIITFLLLLSISYGTKSFHN